MIANRKRTLQSGAAFEGFFEKSIGNSRRISGGMNAQLTVRVVAEVVAKHHQQAAKLAKHLNGPKRLQRLWDWVYGHIQYEKDTPGQEEIRTPNRIWADRVRGVDCDDYSVFISCVLTCWGMAHKLRVTDYGKGYQHIYPIVPQANGGYITMDCVTDQYNYEVPFTKHFDTLMPTYALNGFDTELAGRAARQVRRKAFQQAQTPGQFVAKTRKTIVGKALQKVGQTVAKVNPVFVALRNGLLAALKMNFKGISAKLKYAYVSAQVAQRYGISAQQHARIRQQLLSLQTKFAQAGGSAVALQNAIQKGKGGALQGLGEIEGLGIAPAAVVAVAVPIIEAILAQLKDVQPTEAAVEETDLIEGLDGKPKVVAQKPVKRAFSNTGLKMTQIPLKRPSLTPPSPSLNTSLNRANAQIKAKAQQAAKPNKKPNMAKVVATAAKLGVSVATVLKAVAKKQGNTATTPTDEATVQVQPPVYPNSSPMPFPEKAKLPAVISPDYESVEAEAVGPETRIVDKNGQEITDQDPKTLGPTNNNSMGWLLAGTALVGVGILLSSSSEPKAKTSHGGLSGTRKPRRSTRISRNYQLQ